MILWLGAPVVGGLGGTCKDLSAQSSLLLSFFVEFRALLRAMCTSMLGYEPLSVDVVQPWGEGMLRCLFQVANQTSFV